MKQHDKSLNDDMHKIRDPVFPQWPLRGSTLFGTLWLSLPAAFRLSVYRLLRYLGEKIWPKQWMTGATGKQRLPFNLFCKYGGRIALPEVMATIFVFENTTIPVPRILDVVHEGEDLFVLMTRLPGVPAGTEEAIGQFDEAAWCALEDDLRDWIRQLRALNPPTAVVGSFLQTPNLQRRVYMHDPIGPWRDIAAFHEYLVTRCPEDQGNDAYREFRRVAQAKIFSKNHRLCFTHGDLVPHNLLIQNGRLSGMVDFECSGWFPEYWDYTGTLCFMPEDRWKQAVRNVFGNAYKDEVEAEQLFWEANSGNI